MHSHLADTLAGYCCCSCESAIDMTNVTENGFVISLLLNCISRGYYTEFRATFTILCYGTSIVNSFWLLRGGEGKSLANKTPNILDENLSSVKNGLS